MREFGDEKLERMCPNCKIGMHKRYQARYGKDLFICSNCGNAEGIPGF